jgi:transcriptional regulator with XRE-family HTH domain
VKSLGTAIREHRLRVGLRQHEIVDEAMKLGYNIDQGSLSRWENDKAVPLIEDVAHLEVIFGLSKGRIFIDTGYVDLASESELAIAKDPRLNDQFREFVLLALKTAIQSSLGR